MKNVLKISLLVLALYLGGCAPHLTQYQKYTRVNLAKDTPAEQTQGNITIKLQPLNDNEYDKSWYTQTITLPFISPTTNRPMTADEDHLIRLFSGLTAFEVTIINNTDHILRMKDARIVYIDPDRDDPFYALENSQIYTDPIALPCFMETMDEIEKKTPISDAGALSNSVQAAIRRILDHITFVNGFNKEIMPGMRTRGYIIFKINPAKAAEGKVSFIDMVSETDQAGNPVKKVRFDYKVAPIIKYYKSVYDKNSRKYQPWEETTEQDYDTRLKSK